MQEVQFVRNNSIVKELVLVDGLPRSGKSLMGPILSSFERVEIERMELVIEFIPMFYRCNKIKKDAAISLLRLEIDEMLYNSMISRNTNFRFRDRTGVFNNLKFFKHFRRLFVEDGDSVIEKIRRESPIFQIQTHNMLRNLDVFLEAFNEGLRVIEMVRHPVDLVYSMDKRGFGSVLGTNPRYWHVAIKSHAGDIPFFAAGWVDDFLAESPINRVIKMVRFLSREMNDKYKSIPEKHKKKILIIPFEKFVIAPDKYLEHIEKLISSKISKKTKKTLKMQNVPRQIDNKERERRIEEISKKASEEGVRILHDIISEYEEMYL